MPSSLDSADRIWLAMSDSNRTRILSRALAKGMDMTVYLGRGMDPDGPLGIVVADDAHADCIAKAAGNAAPCQKSILVTAGGRQTANADIVLGHDIDAGTLANAIEGMRGWRGYEMARSSGAAHGTALMSAMTEADFMIRTLDEARDAAVCLALGLPRTETVSVGIYVLLAAAIEHGNLEFSARDKAEALAAGKWAGRVRQRMAEPGYASRHVRLGIQRGGRIISLLVQDDGPGFDADTAEMANPSRAGYRGRLIKFAESLGFSQISFLGIGNTMEASIVLPAEDMEMPRAAAAR